MQVNTVVESLFLAPRSPYLGQRLLLTSLSFLMLPLSLWDTVSLKALTLVPLPFVIETFTSSKCLLYGTAETFAIQTLFENRQQDGIKKAAVILKLQQL